MKIGELAKKCNISQTTIRYYVQSGLLIPDDSSPQYDFTERELQYLQMIIRMRQQSFSINEIQAYLSLIRLSNFIEPETIGECIRILTRKKREIAEQIATLQQSFEDIGREINELHSRAEIMPSETGVPLSALPLLVCPSCGRALRIENASICDNHIISGKLICKDSETCEGYSAVIENGIIKTANRYTGVCDSPDLGRGMYRNMGYKLSRCLQKGYDYISSRLLKQDCSGKVILEANINGYFFLYNHLRLLPQDCLFILVDKFPEMLEMYRSLIGTLGLERNILYIADSKTDYPLKNASVDILISYFGENEHQLYNPNPYVQDARRFLKEDSVILGALLSYKQGAKSRKNLQKKYLESSPRCFQIDYLKEDYARNGFGIETTLLDSIEDTDKKDYSFECQEKGEPIFLYSFFAKPKKQNVLSQNKL